MRLLLTLICAAMFVAIAFTTRADHARPGLFGDVGAPPTEEDISHGNALTKLMVERCTKFVNNMRADDEGHILDYIHDYQTGFCLGWISASMVFLNIRDSAGAPALGVCLPEGIHTGVVVKTFLEYAKQNPEDWKYNPSFLIYWSMLGKYPCAR